MSPSRKPPPALEPGSLSLPPGQSGSADFTNTRSSVSRTNTTAPEQHARFDNVRSSVSSTEQSVGGHMYSVAKGDTLSHIAKAHYGKASLWPRIFDANRDQLDDPDLILPGQVLHIPRDAS